MSGSDPAAIVISRRTLGWAGAALFALFSGGQVASLKLVGDDGPDPQTAALGIRVDQLSAKMEQTSAKVDQLSADGQARDAHFNRILSAVLIFQIESDRFWRESSGAKDKPRSPELEAAARRLRELADEKR